MMRTQISLDPRMYRQAQAEARRQGISVAELLRRALASALAGSPGMPAKPWMRHAGVIAGDGSDESDNAHVDAVVYGRR